MLRGEEVISQPSNFLSGSDPLPVIKQSGAIYVCSVMN